MIYSASAAGKVILGEYATGSGTTGVMTFSNNKGADAAAIDARGGLEINIDTVFSGNSFTVGTGRRGGIIDVRGIASGSGQSTNSLVVTKDFTFNSNTGVAYAAAPSSYALLYAEYGANFSGDTNLFERNTTTATPLIWIGGNNGTVTAGNTTFSNATNNSVTAFLGNTINKTTGGAGASRSGMLLHSDGVISGSTIYGGKLEMDNLVVTGNTAHGNTGTAVNALIYSAHGATFNGNVDFGSTTINSLGAALTGNTITEGYALYIGGGVTTASPTTFSGTTTFHKNDISMAVQAANPSIGVARFVGGAGTTTTFTGLLTFSDNSVTGVDATLMRTDNAIVMNGGLTVTGNTVSMLLHPTTGTPESAYGIRSGSTISVTGATVFENNMLKGVTTIDADSTLNLVRSEGNMTLNGTVLFKDNVSAQSALVRANDGNFIATDDTYFTSNTVTNRVGTGGILLYAVRNVGNTSGGTITIGTASNTADFAVYKNNGGGSAGSSNSLVYATYGANFYGAATFEDNTATESSVLYITGDKATFSGQTAFVGNTISMNEAAPFNTNNIAIARFAGVDQNNLSSNISVSFADDVWFENNTVTGGGSSIMRVDRGAVFSGDLVMTDNSVTSATETTYILRTQNDLSVAGDAVFTDNVVSNGGSIVRVTGPAAAAVAPVTNVTFSGDALFDSNTGVSYYAGQQTVSSGASIYSLVNSQFLGDVAVTNNNLSIIDTTGSYVFRNYGTLTFGTVGASNTFLFDNNNGTVVYSNQGDVTFNGDTQFSNNFNNDGSSALNVIQDTVTFNGKAIFSGNISYVNGEDVLDRTGSATGVTHDPITERGLTNVSAAVSTRQANYVFKGDTAFIDNKVENFADASYAIYVDTDAHGNILAKSVDSFGFTQNVYGYGQFCKKDANGNWVKAALGDSAGQWVTVGRQTGYAKVWDPAANSGAGGFIYSTDTALMAKTVWESDSITYGAAFSSYAMTCSTNSGHYFVAAWTILAACWIF